MLLQPSSGKALWVRDEALASIESLHFVEAMSLTTQEEDELARKAAAELTYGQRLAMQQTSLVASLLDLIATYLPNGGAITLENKPVKTSDGFNPVMRHKFGFDKMAVASTEVGRLMGLSLDGGEVKWSRLEEPGQKVVLSRPAPVGTFRPELMLIKSAPDETSASSTATFVDALNGMDDAGATATVKVAKVAQLVPLDFKDVSGREVFMAVGEGDEATKSCLLPYSAEGVARVEELAGSLYYHVIDKDAGTIVSYMVGAAHPTDKGCYTSSVVASAVLAPPGEKITTLAYRNADEKVNSPAEILGDDSLLLKYLNPHLVAVVTEGTVTAPSNASEASPTLYVSLVDTVSARVLHRVQHTTASAPASIVMSENWVVYSYWNTKAHRTELSALALYEGMIDTYGLNPFKVPEQQETFSSFTAPAPVVMQRSFIFPRAITSLAFTVTARGITSKNLLIGLESGQVASLHRRFIDPRRPNGKPSKTEMMEGLMTYHAVLPNIPHTMVTVNGSVMGLETIHATSAVIESTSLVVSKGIDMFFARVTPSKTFDLLAADFNRPMLLMLLFGLTAALVATKGMDKRKKLAMAWK